MHYKLIAFVCFSGWLVQGVVPSFRILAPPFVCPKNKDDVIDKPDNTIITLQTDSRTEVNYTWTVRWTPLANPTQHFTVSLWRVVRKLEMHLNGPQTEPGVYVIDNSQLLSGVNYMFNVTAPFPENDEAVEKSFRIDNIKGDQQLLIEGQSSMFSIVVVGGQVTYADLNYVLEAQVTTCYKTHDYYFEWSVSSVDSSVDVSYARGSRLEIIANSLTPGLSYDVLCRVFKHSNGEMITENGLPFQVLHRDLKVNFNIDVLLITVGTTFDIPTNIKTIDYVRNELEITWDCTLNGEHFKDFYVYDDSAIIFPLGLPTVGQYTVSVTIAVINDSLITHSNALVVTVEHQLPTIEVYLTPRLINKDSIVHLGANISAVVPGCSVIWYFIPGENLLIPNTTNADVYTEIESGIPISDAVNFYSLEENFLNELTDYSNETSWKLVEAQLEAATGTARLIVKCQCDKIDNCNTEGIVYADVKLVENENPIPGNILVMPETGTAMETMFRISTIAAVDPNRPLQYTFFCGLGYNDSLTIGTYVEHLAVETLLPYKDGGTSVWIEVCDSLGACATSSPMLVDLTPGDARTLDALIEEMQALVMRCELMLLRRLVSSAIVTYGSADQTDANEKFTSALLTALKSIHQNCTEAYYDQFNDLLQWLAEVGLETTDLK